MQVELQIFIQAVLNLGRSVNTGAGSSVVEPNSFAALRDPTGEDS